LVLDEDVLDEVWQTVGPVPDERQRRVIAGAMVAACGRGEVTGLVRAAGMSRSAVTTGAREVANNDTLQGRVRRPGAGRPSRLDTDPDVVPALDSLVDPELRGNPMSPLRWTTKMLVRLEFEMERLGTRSRRSRSRSCCATTARP